MTEYENMSQVWEQRPEGGEEGELIKVGADTYKWNDGFRNWLLFEEGYKRTDLEGDLSVERHLVVGGDATVRGKHTVEGDLEVKGRLSYGASGTDIEHITGDLQIDGKTTVKKDLKVLGKIEANNINTPYLGLFSSLESLKRVYPNTSVGNYAVIGNTIPGPVYRFGETGWRATGEQGGGAEIELNDYYTKQDIDGKYINIVKWSGIVVELAMIQPGYASTSVYTNIRFVKNAGCFAYYEGGRYYRSWSGIENYQTTEGLLKNIFKDKYGNVWIATSKATIMQVNTDAPQDGDIYGRSNGAWVPTKKGGYPEVVQWSGEVIEDATVLASGSGEAGSIVYINSKNTFALGVGVTIGGYERYYAEFTDRTKFQKNVYSTVDFNPQFTQNIFKGSDGSVWVADSETSISKVSENIIKEDAPKDGKKYVRQDSSWGVIENEIYQLPGDITKGFTLSNYDKVLGTYTAFRAAFDAGKAIISKGILIKVEKILDDASLKSFNLTYNYVDTSDNTLRYVFLNMTADGSAWTDDPTNDTYSIKGTLA